MSLYPLLLFVHVCGVVCLFIGMGIWLFGSIAIERAARVEQVRAIADLLLMARLLVPAGAFVVIAAGLTMALLVWGLQTGWIAVALGSLLIIGPIGTWVIDPRVRAIAALARGVPNGPLPAQLITRTYDRILHTALHTTTAMLFGIIFLMTAKPPLTIAVGAIAVAALLGLVSSVSFVCARHGRESARCDQHEEDAQ